MNLFAGVYEGILKSLKRACLLQPSNNGEAEKGLEYYDLQIFLSRGDVIDSKRGVQIFKSLHNFRHLREILKIVGCNIGLLQKSRGAIACLSPLQLRPC